jgi:hypothetical protein
MCSVTSIVDTRARRFAYQWLAVQTRIHGKVLPWSLLLEGFMFDDRRVPLVNQQGIFEPQVFPELPHQLRTFAGNPPDDPSDRSDHLAGSTVVRSRGGAYLAGGRPPARVSEALAPSAVGRFVRPLVGAPQGRV